jgi:hypothetical protein
MADNSRTDLTLSNIAQSTIAHDPRVAERLAKLSKLEPDWDGYGGSPPTEEAISRTKILLREIHKLTEALWRSRSLPRCPMEGLISSGNWTPGQR